MERLPTESVYTGSALGELLSCVDLLCVTDVLTDGADVVQVGTGVLPVVPGQAPRAAEVSVLLAGLRPVNRPQHLSFTIQSGSVKTDLDNTDNYLQLGR